MGKDYILISDNLKLKSQPKQLECICSNGSGSLFAERSKATTEDNLTIFLDGYIIAKNRIFEEYEPYDQLSILKKLYYKHGDHFLNYIKGVFTVIIAEGENLKIFTDHLGLKKAFYYISGRFFCISNNYQIIIANSYQNKINENALAIKSLLNREVFGETLIKGIQYTLPATRIHISESGEVGISQYWDEKSLLHNNKLTSEIEPFEDLLLQNIKNIHGFFEPKETAITLTGGKDSRTALAALLKQGIKPLGITYGNHLTIDAVYAKKLADKAGIEHIIVNPVKSLEWFEEAATKIIELNNPLLNIHRAHRHFAIKALQNRIGQNATFYSGYMGGELLMGVYFDNLIFTNLIKDFWKNGSSELESIPARLEKNFIRKNTFDIEQVKTKLLGLKTFDAGKNIKDMQFHSMFEIGVLHHSQDIEIANHYFDFPVPFFLDIEFLELLFRSEFNFREQNVETKNLLKRHSLFKFNLSLQHKFYPELDSVYYAKKGTYNTKEFLRGPVYWSMVKTMRYFLKRKKYPPTFAYDENYRLFLIKKLKEIIADNSSPINEVYDVPKALDTLLNEPLLRTESPLHKYSNIVMHYLQYKRYTNA